MNLNIAFLQLLPGKTQEKNLEKGLLACRESKEKGAELILVPNACPMEINRLAQLRGRTYENMLAIATCNYPAPHPDCNGHSTLFDGVVYLPDEPGSRDTCVLETPEEEGIYLATLDLSMLRSYREEERPGAWRHPEKYGILTDTEIAYPFCP